MLRERFGRRELDDEEEHTQSASLEDQLGQCGDLFRLSLNHACSDEPAPELVVLDATSSGELEPGHWGCRADETVAAVQ